MPKNDTTTGDLDLRIARDHAWLEAIRGECEQLISDLELKSADMDSLRGRMGDLLARLDALGERIKEERD